MKYFQVKPAVDGSEGDKTIFDRERPPRGVIKLDYCFDDWLGDELLCTGNQNIVTERLAQAIAASSLSGYVFDDVVVSKSETFYDLNENDMDLPEFRWLKIFGTEGIEDFGKTYESMIVSEAAMEILLAFNLSRARITEWEWPYSTS